MTLSPRHHAVLDAVEALQPYGYGVTLPRKVTRPFDPDVKLFLTTVRRRHPETCPCTDCT